MLTVMQANTSAFNMYTRLGYALDASSPGIVEPEEECGYEILSKSLVPTKRLPLSEAPSSNVAPALAALQVSG